MKHFFTALLAVLLSCMACLAAPTTKKFDIHGNFSGIEAGGIFKIDYTPAPTAEVKITTDARCMDKIKVYVKDGTLVLATTGNIENTKIKVTLKAPKIDHIDLGGVAEFITMSPLSVTDMIIRTGGSSEVKLSGVNATGIDIISSGASEAKLGAVICETLKAVAGGSSEIKCSTLAANTLTATASGASEIKLKGINANTLTAGASGSSEIKLAGHANTAALDAGGAAEIQADDLTANGGTARASGSSEITCHIAGLTPETSGTASVRNL